MEMYRLFDLCIASEVSLPGLSSCEDEIPVWTISIPKRDIKQDGFEWFHTWQTPGGQYLGDCARRGTDYQLNLLDQAIFRIFFSAGTIEAYPRAGCTVKTLAHLLLDQVIPRAICHTGRMVMHASAVQLADGRSVAFTGPSGRGKSTLASAFRKAGHRLLSDDCLLIEKRQGAVWATPPYPSLRLWPDSADSMIDASERDSARFSDMVQYSDKKQLLFENKNSRGPMWVSLSSLYLLQEPSLDGESCIHIEPVGGMATVMALVESLFALDVVRKEGLKKYFDTVASVADGFPVFKLDYLRDYGILPAVVERINAGPEINCGK